MASFSTGRSIRLSSLAVVLALVAVACSSTATDPPSPGDAITDPLAGPVDDPAAPVTPSGSPAAAALVRPPVVPSSPAEAAATSGDAPRAGTPRFGPPGQGIGPDSIKIGFWLLDVSAACEATGVQVSTCADDDRGETEAINEYINANGGIAGRKIEAVIIKSSIDRSHAAQAQAACEAFALDHKVFAVLVPPQPARTHLPTCLASHGVPMIDAGMWPFDRVDYATVAGFYFQPDRPRPERWVRAYIDGLHDQGFFEAGSRIGLVRWDAAVFQRVTERVLKKRLAAYGLKLTEEAAISPPDGMSGYGSMNGQVSNAVLRFRSSGVDRVLFFADIGEVQTFWFPAAESQGYRPRYGLTSTDTPGQSLEELAPTAQLNGAVGIGWNPAFDVNPNQDPGGSPAATLCKKILVDGGQDGGAGRNLKCDNAFFLKAVLDRAPALNVRGFRYAVENLGRRFEPSGTFATRFGPGVFDGPTRLRYFAFQQGCGCFQYVGGERPLR